jgi:hypothetical protein
MEYFQAYLTAHVYLHDTGALVNLAKERNVPFSGPCLSKTIHKNPNNFTDHCKGFKHCFPMNEHAPVERSLRH